MRQITVDQLKARIDAGEKLNILDVREDIERADFNIGGTHFRLGRIQSMAIEDIEDLKDEEVIVYCRSGNRSQQACMMLEHMGFKNTVNVAGGMLNWEQKFGR
ncbi:rhodanese-like domain-containing protein [Segetibacter sp.]|jgi:rhodanese-related sulfurtransferase|uniref:rhodanese-like domain-containing protein n=1 Tax=Segetibacter sp. TaxID=2231182 RepID=UPI002622E010|nr:rhodanese-like domain-containing protein [Segetibacter sp.]MCW3081959.1 rhodanese-like protein [Segetibacter sp.]